VEHFKAIDTVNSLQNVEAGFDKRHSQHVAHRARVIDREYRLRH
jgi:hypothetical protein